jgi:hypothetical protein
MLSRFSFAKKSSCAARTNYIYKSARSAAPTIFYKAMFIKKYIVMKALLGLKHYTLRPATPSSKHSWVILLSLINA